LKKEELGIVNFSHYTLGAFFCRQSASHGGVGIFVPKNIQHYTIDLDSFNNEKDFEVCALKLNILSISFMIICIYRSQTGNFFYFIHQSESILNKIYQSSCELILCGDFNINYLNDSSRKDLLNSLLASLNLFSTIKFPTRISYNSTTLIDNIFIKIYRHEFAVHPLINELCDHDAQILTLMNIFTSTSRQVPFFTRKINNHSISNFMYLLSYENWEDVFLETNVNTIVNNFLNIFLRIFYSSFPLRKSQHYDKPKP
jgi:hypothetical protein